MKKRIDIPVIPEDAHLPQADFEVTLQGFTQYENQPRSLVTIKTDAVTLGEILPTMEDFLRGLGFHFNGHLDIVDEEE